jgi:hypothetical protein
MRGDATGAILAALGGGGVVAFGNIVAATRLTRQTVGALLGELLKQGRVTRPSHGMYQLVRGADTESPPRPPRTIADYPDLVAQWHPTRNGTIAPADVTYGSARRVWWRCPNGPDHEWQARASNRSLYENGCPFCSGHRRGC